MMSCHIRNVQRIGESWSEVMAGAEVPGRRGYWCGSSFRWTTASRLASFGMLGRHSGRWITGGMSPRVQDLDRV